MVYLASITKGLATASEVINAIMYTTFLWLSDFSQFVTKMNTVHDRHGVARRARGLLF